MANEYEKKTYVPVTMAPSEAGFRDDEPEQAEASGRAAQVKQDVKETGQQAAAQAKEQARSLAASATESAKGVAKESKETLSVRMDHVANALREAGTALDRDFESGLARLSEDAAKAIEDFSRDLKTQDVGTLVQRVEGFARSHPGAFLGSSLALGLAIGRFLHASSPAVDYESPGTEAIGEGEPLSDAPSYPGSTVEPY